MKSSAIPTRLQIPFANGAGSSYVRDIPVASQVGISDGAASYTDGFPPINFSPIEAGGVPFDGRDVNGVLRAVSAWSRWQAAAGAVPFDSTFCTAIGGYPLGATLLSSDGAGIWLSVAEDNTNDPNGTGSNWVPLSFRGTVAIALAGANVTLTPLQYARPSIVLSGTLTANVQLILPSIVKTWIVYNGCTVGSYSVTVKTVAGTGVSLSSGAQQVWNDATNIYNTSTVLPAMLAYLNIPQTWTKPQSCAVVTLADAAPIVWDLSAGQMFNVTIATSRVLGSPFGHTNGTRYELRLVHGAENSALGFSVGYVGVDGLTFSAAAGAVDILVFRSTGEAMELVSASKNVRAGA